MARRLPPPVVISPRFLGSVVGIRDLPNGDLLINDTRNRRVLRSDSMLTVTTVVIDSTEYGSRPASLLAATGDSSLFVEAVTPSMRLIDPSGSVNRTMSVPQPRDVNWLMPSPIAMAGGLDARGRLVRRGAAPRAQEPALKPGEQMPFAYPDTFPIVRENSVTRHSDTIAWVRTLRSHGVRVGLPDGSSIAYVRDTYLQMVDSWSVLADGTVAVLRGQDYHLVTLGPDGVATQHPRIAYEWEPLSDSAKVAFVDSVTAARKQAAQREAASPQRLSAGGAAAPGSGGLSSRNGSPFPPAPPGVRTVDPLTLPDYRPAFTSTPLIPDANGNVWVRTTRPSPDPAMWIYDVIDRLGQRVDRVLLARDRTIVGFDRRGHVYLVAKEDGGAQTIERVRWR